jgi:hypothetical protein
LLIAFASCLSLNAYVSTASDSDSIAYRYCFIGITAITSTLLNASCFITSRLITITNTNTPPPRPAPSEGVCVGFSVFCSSFGFDSAVILASS